MPEHNSDRRSEEGPLTDVVVVDDQPVNLLVLVRMCEAWAAQRSDGEVTVTSIRAGETGPNGLAQNIANALRAELGDRVRRVLFIDHDMGFSGTSGDVLCHLEGLLRKSSARLDRIALASAAAVRAEIDAIKAAALRVFPAAEIAFLPKPLGSTDVNAFLDGAKPVHEKPRQFLRLEAILRQAYYRQRYRRWLPSAEPEGESLPDYPEIVRHLAVGLESVCGFLMTPPSTSERIFSDRDMSQLRALREQLFVTVVVLRGILGNPLAPYPQEVMAQIHNVAGAFGVLLKDLDDWKVGNVLKTSRRKAPDSLKILELVAQVQTLLPRLSLNAHQVDAMSATDFSTFLRAHFSKDKVHFEFSGESLDRPITAHLLTVYYEAISILVNNALTAEANRVHVYLSFEDAKVAISVTDNGKPLPRGFSIGYERRIGDVERNSRRKASSRGLTDLCVLIRDNDGEAPLLQEISIGTNARKSFKLAFPVAFVRHES